jgi:hypothetical protein
MAVVSTCVRPSPRQLSLREALLLGDGDGATTRQIARGFGRCIAGNSANVRQGCEGIGATAAP